MAVPRALVFLGFMALAACDSCGESGSGAGTNPQPAVTLPAPDLRIVAISDLQGTLAPCGCTSRPLGGINHLVAAIAEESPALFIASGDLLAGGTHHALSLIHI